jgi:hypothetical protein
MTIIYNKNNWRGSNLNKIYTYIITAILHSRKGVMNLPWSIVKTFLVFISRNSPMGNWPWLIPFSSAIWWHIPYTKQYYIMLKVKENFPWSCISSWFCIKIYRVRMWPEVTHLMTGSSSNLLQVWCEQYYLLWHNTVKSIESQVTFQSIIATICYARNQHGSRWQAQLHYMVLYPRR